MIFGAGRMGATIARVLHERGIRVRLVDASAERAREVAKELPRGRASSTPARSIPSSSSTSGSAAGRAAVFCMNDDARNLYGAVLAKRHGVRLTIALDARPGLGRGLRERRGRRRRSTRARSPPRRWSASPTTRAAARSRCSRATASRSSTSPSAPSPSSANKAFKDLPATGSLIGAVVRDGAAMFPHGTDVLRAGDRVIIFVESRRAGTVEQAL